MLVVTDTEIEQCCKLIYWNQSNGVSTHAGDNGEKEFALCLIENILVLLNKDKINDKYIIQYLGGLISLSQYNSNEYELFLDVRGFDEPTKRKALNGKKLSKYEKILLKEIIQPNLGEYLVKGDYQNCCYSSIKVLMITAYCILCNNIDSYIEAIDMIVDLEDDLIRINVHFSNDEINAIYLNWVSTNKINNIYMLYKSKYLGLDNNSILELVSADVIEEDYYYKDERFSIAPSILVKQYCSIVEHEINEIIQLINLPDKPKGHLMWNNMKSYVKKNNINLESTSFKLSSMLEEWHGLRNKAAHGEIITKDDYEIINEYKSHGLFNGISIKKMELKNIQSNLSVDNIGEYMGFNIKH